MANSTDQQIDKFVNILFQREDFTLFSADLYGDVPMMNSSVRRIDNIMLDKSLIDQYKEMRALTDFGLQIAENGGWLEYLSQIEKKESIEMERQRKEDEKLFYDTKISKYLYKTRWWPLIISIISLGVAIWALFKS